MEKLGETLFCGVPKPPDLLAPTVPALHPNAGRAEAEAPGDVRVGRAVPVVIVDDLSLIIAEEVHGAFEMRPGLLHEKARRVGPYSAEVEVLENGEESTTVLEAEVVEGFVKGTPFGPGEIRRETGKGVLFSPP
jgi:hypothetical protein